MGREPYMTPSPVEEFTMAIPTGNEVISLPDLTPRGAIPSLHVLSQQALGLLGMDGEEEALLDPLLLREGGEEVPLEARDWSLRDHWIPEITWLSQELELRGTILTPVGTRGFAYRLEARNPGKKPVEVVLGFQGCWKRLLYTVFRSRALPHITRIGWFDPWTRSLVLEASSGTPILALALATDPSPDHVHLTFPHDATGGFRFQLGRRMRMEPGGKVAVTLYAAVAPEGDGARTTSVDLRRRTWETLFQETETWLHRRRLPLEGKVGEVVQRNLLFCYFYAWGRTIDTEEGVLVTSRSPRYYVSAAYWARDALLWTLPALLLVDPPTAKAALLYAFSTQWRNPGIHAQYLNGSVLYPGFELDELAAYPIAMERYLLTTGDLAILREDSVRKVLEGYPEELEKHRGPHGLYETFLDPSDDPPQYPYLTYDNVLAWRGLVACSTVWEWLGEQRKSQRIRGLADRLAALIQKWCIVEGPLGPMFAWAVDGEGRFQLYDNPPGSLQLLAYYGFCTPDDPVFLNTVRWIHSPHNPHYVQGPFGEAGSAHAPHPWPMAAANSLLAGRREALDFFLRAEMDNGIACETVDVETGRVKTGAAFASCAGWIASAILTSSKWAGSKPRATPSI
ncbi:MAG: glycoside hydrolase family 125 protein [Armatimonadota bacterium]|nr:glycoside hydrolase family 125 protein [Armatimonadota bacterium]